MLANDTDSEGGQLTLLGYVSCTGRRARRRPAGIGDARLRNSIRYDPGNFPGGVAVFTYVVIDDGGRNSIPGGVRVNVAPCSACTHRCCRTTPFAIGRGQTTRCNVLGNDGQTTGTMTVGAATGGTATDRGNGIVEYNAPTTAGSYSFSYTVTNGCGGQRHGQRARSPSTGPRPAGSGRQRSTPATRSRSTCSPIDTDPDGDPLTITLNLTPRSPPGRRSRSPPTESPPSSHHLVRSRPGSFTYTVADCGNGPRPASRRHGRRSTSSNPTVRRWPSRRLHDGPGDASRPVDVTANDTDPDGNTIILTQASLIRSPATDPSVSLQTQQGPCSHRNPCTTATQATFTYWITDGGQPLATPGR